VFGINAMCDFSLVAGQISTKLAPKTTQIYYLMLSMGQESLCFSWLDSSGSYNAEAGESAGHVGILRLN